MSNADQFFGFVANVLSWAKTPLGAVVSITGLASAIVTLFPQTRSWLLKFLDNIYYHIRRLFSALRMAAIQLCYEPIRFPLRRLNRNLNYGVARYQDTILPVFFGYTHRYSLRRSGCDIEFHFYDWDRCNERFNDRENGKLDVALGNLGTCIKPYVQDNVRSLQSQPDVFIPFYVFSNQRVFIRGDWFREKLSTDRAEQIQKLKVEEPRALFVKPALEDIRTDILGTLLTGTKAVAPAGTDLSSCLERLYFNEGPFTPNSSENDLLYRNQDEARRLFLRGDAQVICTGMSDGETLKSETLGSGIDCIELCQGKDLGVRSWNGLLFSSTAMKKYTYEIRQLIEVWFWSISKFKRQLATGDPTFSGSVASFLSIHLGGEAQDKIVNEFRYLFQTMIDENSEYFYDTLPAALMGFYGERIGRASSERYLDSLRQAYEFARTYDGRIEHQGAISNDTLIGIGKSLHRKTALFLADTFPNRIPLRYA